MQPGDGIDRAVRSNGRSVVHSDPNGPAGSGWRRGGRTWRPRRRGVLERPETRRGWIRYQCFVTNSRDDAVASYFDQPGVHHIGAVKADGRRDELDSVVVNVAGAVRCQWADRED